MVLAVLVRAIGTRRLCTTPAAICDVVIAGEETDCAVADDESNGNVAAAMASANAR
jgi:hypothetical protein